MKRILLILLLVLAFGCAKDDDAAKNATPVLSTIIIGTQVWSNKNLDLTTYRDGTPIPQVTEPADWANLTTGAWCYYNNDSSYGSTYGKLYNWYAVMGIFDEASKTDSSKRKKLAPEGFHVPSDEEWTILYTYLGGDILAGDKMKETASSHWNSPSTVASNSSGFTGLPGGYRYDFGPFFGSGIVGYWWSSTEISTGTAWHRVLINQSGTSNRAAIYKRDGLSVRCLMD